VLESNVVYSGSVLLLYGNLGCYIEVSKDEEIVLSFGRNGSLSYGCWQAKVLDEDLLILSHRCCGESGVEDHTPGGVKTWFSSIENRGAGTGT
jgi:hypothetical protein